MGINEIKALTAARTGIKRKADKPEPKTEAKKSAAPKKGKRIKPKSKKTAKRDRKLAKEYQKTLDPWDICEIQSPVCTQRATVINHNQGRGVNEVHDKSKWAKCCPPCNGYIEAHPDWAGGKFKISPHVKGGENNNS